MTLQEIKRELEWRLNNFVYNDNLIVIPQETSEFTINSYLEEIKNNFKMNSIEMMFCHVKKVEDASSSIIVHFEANIFFKESFITTFNLYLPLYKGELNEETIEKLIGAQ